MEELRRSLRAALERARDPNRVPPKERVLFSVALDGHEATGLTVHRAGGLILPKPASLTIVAYDGEPGYYLMYLDAGGGWQTDTYHDMLEGAYGQAEFEFGVLPSAWTKHEPG